MLVSEANRKERQYIVSYARDLAGKWTEESWKIVQCASVSELEDVVRKRIKTDIICIDLTMDGSLDLAKAFRRGAPSSYMILIASPGISPTVYMRPAIGAESLMLKPLSEPQIQEVLEEALSTYLRRFYGSDKEKIFVIENKGGRCLIDYENIFFFEAREKKVFLNTGMEEYGFYDTLDQLEGRLEDGFIRCHRSFLVNKAKIRKVFLSQNRLILEEDFEIPLSRSYKPGVRSYLEKGGRTAWLN